MHLGNELVRSWLPMHTRAELFAMLALPTGALPMWPRHSLSLRQHAFLRRWMSVEVRLRLYLCA